MKRSVIRIFAGSRDPDFASRHPGYADASHRQRVVIAVQVHLFADRVAHAGGE
jgi:hypothetical protein